MNWFILALVALAAVVAFSLATRQRKDELIQPEELQRALEEGGGILLLDVRTPREYREGHIPGAVLMPHRTVPSSAQTLTREEGQTLVVYCQAGPRARLAQRALIKAGFPKVLHLKGDMSAWRRRGLPMEPSP